MSAAADARDDLVERLRNPAWCHSIASFESPQLAKEETINDMVDAAAEIEGLKLEHQHACQEIGIAAAERDEWKARALAAEARVRDVSPTPDVSLITLAKAFGELTLQFQNIEKEHAKTVRELNRVRKKLALAAKERA